MQSNDEALGRFMTLVDEIVEMAEAIRDAADDHFDTSPDQVDWGHVGDAERTRNILKNELDRIRGEGEYAPEGK